MAEMLVKFDNTKLDSSKRTKTNKYADSKVKMYGNNYVVRSVYRATARYVV